MTGDCHVRFYERRGVRLPPATHPIVRGAGTPACPRRERGACRTISVGFHQRVEEQQVVSYSGASDRSKRHHLSPLPRCRSRAYGGPGRSLWQVVDSQELPALPPITAEVEPMFDYIALDTPRMPPELHVVARLARNYSEGDGGGERLRLALVAGHPVDSHDLIIVAYIWRAETRDVVWGLERWPSPERRLVLYRLDPGFEPLPARQLHAELQHAGAAALADQTRAVLAA